MNPDPFLMKNMPSLRWLPLLAALSLNFSAFAAPKPLAQTADLHARDKVRLVELTADLKGAKELYLVVNDLGDQACDWSDWLDPVLVMADGSTKDLTTLKWKWAEAATGSVNIGKNHNKGPLVVAGKTFAKGIGTHANSVIGYDLPAGVVGFRAQVAIDDGGAIRNNKPSSADVHLSQGDVGPTPASLSECWDPNFASQFITTSFDASMAWGTEAACVFSAAEYARL